LGLGHEHPSRNRLLAQGLTMEWVMPVRGDTTAHMPAHQRVPHDISIPEVFWQLWRPAGSRPCLAYSAAHTEIAARQPCAARAAVTKAEARFIQG
jgi:hypothetical protein